MSMIMTKDGWRYLQPLFRGYGCYNYPNAKEAPVQEGLRYTGALPTRESIAYSDAIARYFLPRSHPQHLTLERCMTILGQRTVIK